MSATYPDVSLYPQGEKRSYHEGQLTISEGGVEFREGGADPATPPLKSWPIPRLTDGAEGPALRVFSTLAATNIQIGPLDRLAMLVIPKVAREDVERALTACGWSPQIQALTLGASELASLRNWAVVFIVIGLSISDSGLSALTGFGMFGVGLWALFAGPRIGILAANGLLLLALAGWNMQTSGLGFWPVVLGFLGFRQLQRWTELKPLLANPSHRAWVSAKLAAPPDDTLLEPAGYVARTIAFLLSGTLAALALVFLMPVALSAGRDHRGLGPALLMLALSGWYLFVTTYPARAALSARRVLPTTGPIAVITFPFLIATCLLAAILS